MATGETFTPDLIKKAHRTIDILKSNEITITSDDIIGGVTLTEAISNDSNFKIGSCVISEINFEIMDVNGDIKDLIHPVNTAKLSITGEPIPVVPATDFQYVQAYEISRERSNTLLKNHQDCYLWCLNSEGNTGYGVRYVKNANNYELISAPVNDDTKEFGEIKSTYAFTNKVEAMVITNEPNVERGGEEILYCLFSIAPYFKAFVLNSASTFSEYTKAVPINSYNIQQIKNLCGKRMALTSYASSTYIENFYLDADDYRWEYYINEHVEFESRKQIVKKELEIVQFQKTVIRNFIVQNITHPNEARAAIQAYDYMSKFSTNVSKVFKPYKIEPPKEGLNLVFSHGEDASGNTIHDLAYGDTYTTNHLTFNADNTNYRIYFFAPQSESIITTGEIHYPSSITDSSVTISAHLNSYSSDDVQYVDEIAISAGTGFSPLNINSAAKMGLYTKKDVTSGAKSRLEGADSIIIADTTKTAPSFSPPQIKLQELLQKLCDHVGIRVEYINDISNGDIISANYFNDISQLTGLELLGYVLELVGGVARITKENKLEILKKFNVQVAPFSGPEGAAKFALDRSSYISLSYSDYSVEPIGALELYSGKAPETYKSRIYCPATLGGTQATYTINKYTISDNPLHDYYKTSSFDSEKVIYDNINNFLTGLVPFSCTTFRYPYLRAGDEIVINGRNGIKFRGKIMSKIQNNRKDTYEATGDPNTGEQYELIIGSEDGSEDGTVIGSED